MQRRIHDIFIAGSIAASALGILGLQGCAIDPEHITPAQMAFVNGGFPLDFSIKKMDLATDPAKNFNHYADGKWLDKAKVPSDGFYFSSLAVLHAKIDYQLRALIEDASQKSIAAPKGSPLQQVGDFYASGIDERRLNKLGVSPLKPLFERIAGSNDKKSLAETLAQLELITSESVLISAAVNTDLHHRQRNAIYFGGGELGMSVDNYLKPEAQAIRDAYEKLVAKVFVLAGSQRDDAQRTARSIIAMETRIAAKELTPVQQRDPDLAFVTRNFADLQSVLSNVDLETYFGALGLPTGGEVIVGDMEELREVNTMLGEYPASDIQEYLRWNLLRHTTAYLDSGFVEPLMDFSRITYGEVDTPSRDKRVSRGLPRLLGHPLSQLYVEKYFPGQSKPAVEDLVARIKAEFRARLAENSWLAASTRQYALEKLDKLTISVGYPTTWIDSSAVDIRRDDYLGNIFRLHAFSMKRNLASLAEPVKHAQFATPGSTLAVDVNAAYGIDINAIEIPAAFLQAPIYDLKADAAVNFCTLGAVVGHELTHGFDSQGRRYDAEGNLRDWWTNADAQNFLLETQKLVKQADAYEAVPGIHMNGQLAVGENLADIGGITLGYAALETYLREHPQENRKIDGLTPEQRCYVSWAQLWADKAKEGWLKQTLAVDPHPPGTYRMFAPAQHTPGFYTAFGIKPGDPMWLDEKDRVHIW